MVLNWIHAKDYTMDTLLLLDRWVIRYWMRECKPYNAAGRDYRADMGKALSRYPHVSQYCKRKAPECAAFVDAALALVPDSLSTEEARTAETAILDYHQSFVVYAYPDVMEEVNYIRCWNPERLYELADLTERIVLDVGAGTGRLAFAAVPLAKRVYASEPCDVMREYMRDRIQREGIANIKVLDGIATDLAFEDNTFDVVMSGHVVGDDFDRELGEMIRVTKPGGWLVCCNGDDEFKRTEPNRELVERGFDFIRYESSEGGIIYNYRKQVVKE